MKREQAEQLVEAALLSIASASDAINKELVKIVTQGILQLNTEFHPTKYKVTQSDAEARARNIVTVLSGNFYIQEIKD
jgi:hypothetical protein